MDFRLPDLTYGGIGLIAAIIVAAKLSQGPNLDAIPTVGSSGWLGSWWAGFKYLTDAKSVLQEGYEKYKSTPFKVAEPNHWTVILTNRKHVEELARASDEFSFRESVNDRIHIEHFLGPNVHHNPYHVAVVRRRLTRNLDVLYPEIRDEIVTSFAEVLDLRENEWKSVPLSIIKKVVCRTNNRVFVGLPLCRDPDWIDFNIRCTFDMLKGSFIVGLFPKFTWPLVCRLFTKVPQCIKGGVKCLGPIIEERQKYLNEYGTEWDNKPNDALSWLMEEAEGQEQTIENLTRRVLGANFAALHPSSNALNQVLFFLAANPQYILPLREEVEGIVGKDGWSKVALDKMRKVDSLFKECLRIEGTLASLSRKAVKDFTFSDGTFIPKGTLIAAVTRPLHRDENVYKDPDAFHPFRFADMHEEDGNDLKHQLTSTSIEYLPFGHGRQACPGRFFAASALKLTLAHVVVTYDLKLEDNATYQPSSYAATFPIPNPHTKVVFRNRVD